jgi:hypothetical protein
VNISALRDRSGTSVQGAIDRFLSSQVEVVLQRQPLHFTTPAPALDQIL